MQLQIDSHDLKLKMAKASRQLSTKAHHLPTRPTSRSPKIDVNKTHQATKEVIVFTEDRKAIRRCVVNLALCEY